MKEIQQEITPITNEDLFIILNHPNAHFDYPIHCHPEYEINLVMNTRDRASWAIPPRISARWTW